MAEISKHLFDSTCRDVPCHVLLHPWHESCITSSLETYKNSVIGSAKFYFIIHLVQNLIKGKKILKRQELIKAAEYYARSTVLGALISATCATFGCTLRRLNGNKFKYYSYILIPNFINGMFIMLEPPSRRGLVVNLFVNLVIEYWINILERKGNISFTKGKQTLLFMVGSALLFYLMRLEGDRSKRTPMLWLFTPERVRRKTDESQNVCPHNGPCSPYVLKGFLKYFSFGFGITLLRVLGPNLSSPVKALSRLRLKDLNMGLFFASYIGILRPAASMASTNLIAFSDTSVRTGGGLFYSAGYHTAFTLAAFYDTLAIVCYLCRRKGYDSAMYALPAGYLAGLSFLFKPSLGFAIASLTGAFKLYSTILYEKKVIPEQIPLPLMLYCFSQGVLFHARFLHYDDCPSYVVKLTNSVTNGLANNIYASLMEAAKRTI